MHENLIGVVSGSFNYRRIIEFSLGMGKRSKQHGIGSSCHSRALCSAQRYLAKGEVRTEI